MGNDTIQLTINGKPEVLPVGSTVLALLNARGVDPATVVVEVNLAIIASSLYGAHVLAASDTVEILRFVGGG